MLTEKEYLTHLSYGVNTCPAIYDAFEELIENYFKLLETYNKLEKSSYSLECQLHEIYYPNALKFEDLQIGMWVYDMQPESEEFTFFKITRTLSESDCRYLYGDKNKQVFFDNMSCHAREFEEGRFFPITKAMYRSENINIK